MSYDKNLQIKEHIHPHFQQYSNVECVAIPNPWQFSALLTFTDAQVAKKLYGKRHTVGGENY